MENGHLPIIGEISENEIQVLQGVVEVQHDLFLPSLDVDYYTDFDPKVNGCYLKIPLIKRMFGLVAALPVM